LRNVGLFPTKTQKIQKILNKQRPKEPEFLRDIATAL